jgi:hypothetical protein
MREQSTSPLQRVTRQRPCPVCRKTDYCGVSKGGDLVVCMRVKSPRVARNGGWVHLLNDGQRGSTPTRSATPPHQPQLLASIEHRHTVYTRLLESFLTLSEAHRLSLIARGLTSQEIEQNQYRSAPQSQYHAAEVARSLSTLSLRGVPGFYLEHGEWRLRSFGTGILIPYRDPQGRIQALQLRRDTVRDRKDSRYLLLSSSGLSGGASTGTPMHFRHPEQIRASRRALITEGALKADIISSHLHCGVVALTGVSCFREGFGQELRSIFPSLREISIAFDSDWREKPQVKAQLFRLMHELSDARLPSHIWTWSSEFKGLDDYLTHGKGRVA